MNIIERINKDKKLKQLLFLILLLTFILFLKIFYEYYIYCKNDLKNEEKIVINNEIKKTNENEIIYSNSLEFNINKEENNIKGLANYKNSASYNVYINIRKHNNGKEILNIVNPKGIELTNVDGLNYINNNDFTGFDITNKTGLILIISDYHIENEVQEWNFKINNNTTDIDIIMVEDKINFSNFLIKSNDDNLYEHDNNTYRYFGSDPNNYVLFNNELYRMIGIFDNKVKLIKYDYATEEMLGNDGAYYGKYLIGNKNYKGSNYDLIANYSWNNYTNNNNWEESNLNNINLNTNFINYLGKSSNLIYNQKIEIMDLEDYYYASNPEYWSRDMYQKGLNVNWIYMGLDEWTKSKVEGTNNYVYFIFNNGIINEDKNYGLVDKISAVRPVFYLKEEIILTSGNGSIENPYQITI